MEHLKTIASIVLALSMIAVCYIASLIIVTTFGIEAIVASAALGYAMIKTIVAVLNRLNAGKP